MTAMALDPGLTAAGGIAILLLVGASAFFSSSELAIFSLASHRVDALGATGGAGGTLAALRADPHRLLVTVLVGNNVANIAAASISTALLVQVLPAGQAVTGATVFTSCFVLVLGEIAPKSYAVSNAESWALRVARPLAVVQRLMSPVVSLFEVATNAVSRVVGGSSSFETYLTREDLETIVLSGEAAGAIDTEEGAMIRGVLDLEETTVREVMVPRVDVVSVRGDADLERVIATCTRERVTRMPVYGATRDDVRGFVDLWDALGARDAGGTLGDVVVDATIVPATKPVDELLAEMQAGGLGMVAVVDEYGAVVGIATLEDVIEEVVGEIFDRDEVDPVRVVDERTAIAHGLATVDYVNEVLDADLPSHGEFETVAGLIQQHTGTVAAAGDRVELGTAVLTVLEASGTRIRRVRIERVAAAGDADGPADAA